MIAREIQRAIDKVCKIAREDGPYQIDPKLFEVVTKSPTKCLFCKHKKDEPFFLPKGTLYPSPDWMFHFKDTHGYDPPIMVEWLFALPYVHKETGASLFKNEKIIR